MNTYVIPDLHGRFDLLTSALDLIGDNKIVFLGDYIDRGPQSAQVVHTIRAGIEAGKPWVALKGNHEDMMAGAYLDDGASWMEGWIVNGGMATIESYGGNAMAMEHDAMWMQNLPLYHQDVLRVYVHAFAPQSGDISKAKPDSLIWNRYPKGADIGHNDKHVVHGHTPSDRGPELYLRRTNLDCGAVFTGRLCVGVFDDVNPGPQAILWVTP